MHLLQFPILFLEQKLPLMPFIWLLNANIFYCYFKVDSYDEEDKFKCSPNWSNLGPKYLCPRELLVQLPDPRHNAGTWALGAPSSVTYADVPILNQAHLRWQWCPARCRTASRQERGMPGHGAGHVSGPLGSGLPVPAASPGAGLPAWCSPCWPCSSRTPPSS